MALFHDSGSVRLQPVRSLQITVDSNYALVTWKPPESGPVARQYVIKARMVKAEADWDEMHRTKSDCQCKIDLAPLQADTQYELCVVSMTIRGDGPLSSCCSFTTPAKRPSTAPRDIRVIDRTNDTLQLEWDPPSSSNGTISSYNVYYDELAKETRFECLTVSSTHVAIRHLFPGTWYRVQS